MTGQRHTTHTNESSDCPVPESVHQLVVVRAVEGRVDVPVIQVANLASGNLAMEHEVLHVVVSRAAACSVVADLAAACPRHQPQLVVQLELEAE